MATVTRRAGSVRRDRAIARPIVPILPCCCWSASSSVPDADWRSSYDSRGEGGAATSPHALRVRVNPTTNAEKLLKRFKTAPPPASSSVSLLVAGCQRRIAGRRLPNPKDAFTHEMKMAAPRRSASLCSEGVEGRTSFPKQVSYPASINGMHEAVKDHVIPGPRDRPISCVTENRSTGPYLLVDAALHPRHRVHDLLGADPVPHGVVARLQARAGLP